MQQHIHQTKESTPPVIFLNDKPRLFIYLNYSFPHLLNFLKQLATDFEILGYVPNMPKIERSLLNSINVKISEKPLAIHTAIAQCDMVICHGGIGTVSHAIMQIKPMVLFPSHTEQSLLFYQLIKKGFVFSNEKGQLPSNVVKKHFFNAKLLINNIKKSNESLSDYSNVWHHNILDIVKTIK